MKEFMYITAEGDEIRKVKADKNGATIFWDNGYYETLTIDGNGMGIYCWKHGNGEGEVVLDNPHNIGMLMEAIHAVNKTLMCEWKLVEGIVVAEGGK